MQNLKDNRKGTFTRITPRADFEGKPPKPRIRASKLVGHIFLKKKKYISIYIKRKYVDYFVRILSIGHI